MKCFDVTYPSRIYLYEVRTTSDPRFMFIGKVIWQTAGQNNTHVLVIGYILSQTFGRKTVSIFLLIASAEHLAHLLLEYVN